MIKIMDNETPKITPEPTEETPVAEPETIIEPVE
jgi:hypothetical protein